MEASIYIDVLFFCEWVMDFFLLWAAGRIAGFSAKKWRLLLGAFLSAFSHCILVYFFFPLKGGLILSTGLMLLGLVIAYFPKKFRNCLRLLFATYLASFLMGGGLSVLFTTTDAQQFLGNGMRLSVRFFPWQYLLWGILIGYFMLKMGAKWVETHIRRRQDFCTIAIQHLGKQAVCRALIDTGNSLKYEGVGVMILELSTVLPLFSKETQVDFMTGGHTGLLPISFHSLGNPTGGLWGFICEKASLSFGEKVIEFQDIYVGIAFEPFTGAHEGLVPPCLIEEEMT